MEQSARAEQIKLPINYYWNITDPMLPFASSAPGNPFLFPPDNATWTPPPADYPKGLYPCWSPDAQNWVLLPDYRQVRLWSKETGEEIFSGTINCPATAIDIEPPSKYCSWDADKQEWVKDQSRADVAEATERQKLKTAELNLAGKQITQLDEIVTELGDDEEAQPYADLLKLWKSYRAKLNLLKADKLTATFPTRPTLFEDL